MSIGSQLTKFSLCKSWLIICSCIISIISTTIFCFSSILSPLKPLSFFTSFMMPSAIAMILSMTIAFASTIIFENKRNFFLKIDVLEYLKLLSKHEITYNLAYYELISILYHVVRQDYLNCNLAPDKKPIVNILHLILSNNSSNGLANQFVYQKRNAFAELCAYALEHRNEQPGEILIENSIYTKYEQLLNCNETPQKKKYLTSSTLIRFTKIFLFIACIVALIPNYSLIFNFTAIALLGFDIWSSKN